MTIGELKAQYETLFGPYKPPSPTPAPAKEAPAPLLVRDILKYATKVEDITAAVNEEVVRANRNRQIVAMGNAYNAQLAMQAQAMVGGVRIVPTGIGLP